MTFVCIDSLARGNCKVRFYLPAQVNHAFALLEFNSNFEPAAFYFVSFHFILGWEDHKDCCVQVNIIETGIQNNTLWINYIIHFTTMISFILEWINQPLITMSLVVVAEPGTAAGVAPRGSCQAGGSSSPGCTPLPYLIWPDKKYIYILGHQQIECTSKNVPTFRVCFLFNCGKCY